MDIPHSLTPELGELRGEQPVVNVSAADRAGAATERQGASERDDADGPGLSAAPRPHTLGPVRDAGGIAGRYLWLWLLGLVLGWFEGAVVVYLRELYYPDGFGFPLVVLTNRVAVVELVREAASILLLAAAARLAGRWFLERFAAFMILFGIWDLVYYLVLKLVLDWPESLATWDILFLIPLPWVGPVWAPCVISIALVTVGSYLYWTPERPRRHGVRDWAVVTTGGVIVILSFLAGWRVVIEERVPEDFPAWLFWLGFLLSLGWFLHVERRTPLPVRRTLAVLVFACVPALAAGGEAPGAHEGRCGLSPYHLLNEPQDGIEDRPVARGCGAAGRWPGRRQALGGRRHGPR